MSEVTVWCGAVPTSQRYDEGLLTAKNATVQRIITMWFVSPLVGYGCIGGVISWKTESVFDTDK